MKGVRLLAGIATQQSEPYMKCECTKGIITRPMTDKEQHKHHQYIIARANQSITAKDGFADNSIFFKLVVQEAHTFTDKDGVVWAVS